MVEYDPAVRDGLLLLLGVDGVPARGYASAEALLEYAPGSEPICLVTDVWLPGMTGPALHRHLIAQGGEPAVIMITAYGDVQTAVAAMKAGVIDFVTKPFDPVALLVSIRVALSTVAKREQIRRAKAELNDRFSSLTARESTVLSLLAEGAPNKIVANRLEISIRTIEHHRAQIMRKLNVTTVSQLIRLVLEIGVTP